ncbi:unnamed protein product [Choristocarpus tenellus]
MLQAKHEGLDLLVVPLKGGEATTPMGPYVTTVLDALRPLRIEALYFGDLHLEDIRGWREDTFSKIYPCRFPLFGVPYNDLLGRLFSMVGFSIRVTSVREGLEGVGGLKVGHPYNHDLVEVLKAGVEGIDIMGENGEFHTHIYHDEYVVGLGESSSDEEDTSEEGD